MVGDGTSVDSTTLRKSSAGPQSYTADLVPGSIVADRYRIVSTVGSGGMGVVYRAQDLRLGEDVALKFLPLAADEVARKRLLDEVRLGRRISHPAVCRIYDVVEAEGRRFLSMQYIEGEDLASLLRRVGPLPVDRALELGREICAGLAVAHDLGIVHRDLKPGNVMVDARGRARITDFGLAKLLEEDSDWSSVVGTPCFMAPEQLAGRKVTVRTDLYAFALVQFELLTGRRLISGRSLNEIRSSHRTNPLRSSDLPLDLDPAVVEVLRRCVEPDPTRRPPSARAVLAGLPGADPIDAALRAGETPAPDMVAAASVGAMGRRGAWACLLGFLVTVAAVVIHGEYSRLDRLIPLDWPPQALAAHARRLALDAGLPAAGIADQHSWFEVDWDHLRWLVAENGTPWRDVAQNHPGPIRFVYRASPHPLVAGNRWGTVTARDPPAEAPGMVTIELDHRGELVRMEIVPPAEVPPSTRVPAWDRWMKAAGLDPASLQVAEPTRVPPTAADGRRSWISGGPETASSSIRVDAAFIGARATYFGLSGPWADSGGPGDMKGPLRLSQLVDTLWVALYLGGIVASGWLALRNHRRRSGDLEGSVRVGAAVFLLLACGWAFAADHAVWAEAELSLLVTGLGHALFWAAFCWLCYFAVEPYVRRIWPRLLVGWKRLLQGRLGDPLVGRDLLIGCAAGPVLFLIREVVLMPTWYSWMPLRRLTGPAETISAHLLGEFWALQNAFLALLMLFLIRLVVRRTAAAVVLGSAVFIVAYLPDEPLMVAVPTTAFIVGLHVAVLFRFGFLALVTSASVNNFLEAAVWTLDPTSWYFARGLVQLVVLTAFAVAAFRAALAGSAALPGELLDT